jgi:hypothetical protein
VAHKKVTNPNRILSAIISLRVNGMFFSKSTINFILVNESNTTSMSTAILSYSSRLIKQGIVLFEISTDIAGMHSHSNISFIVDIIYLLLYTIINIYRTHMANIILFTDRSPLTKELNGQNIQFERYSRPAGAYKIASVLRDKGYTV